MTVDCILVRYIPVEPENIVCTMFQIPEPECTSMPCIVDFQGRWKNIGGTAGTFTPRVSVDGEMMSVGEPTTLQPGEEIQWVGGLGGYGTPLESITTDVILCPVPN